MKSLIRRLPKFSERNCFMLVLFVAVFLGQIYTRGQMALLLYAVIPWAIGLMYRQHRMRSVSRTLANGFLLTGSGIMLLAAVVRGGYDMTSWLPLMGAGAYALVASQPPRGMTDGERRRELSSVAGLLVALVTPFLLIAVASVLTGRPIYIPGEPQPLGIPYPGGITERIWVFAHPNSVARWAVLGALLAIYLMVISRKVWQRLLLGICVVILMMANAHTQSRTGNIALAAAVGAILFRLVWTKLEGCRWRVAPALVVWIVGAAAVLEGVSLLYSLDVRVASGWSLWQTALAEETAPMAVSRTVTDGTFDVFSNGRDIIWKTSWEYMLENPKYFLLGMGPGEIQSRVMAGADPIWSTVGHLHNSFIESLVRGGLPFLICAVGYLCTLVRPAIRLLTEPSSDARRGMFMLPVLLGALVLMSLTESMLFVSATAGNCLFFWVSGHILNDDEQKRKIER